MGKIVLQQWIATPSHKKGSALGPLLSRSAGVSAGCSAGTGLAELPAAQVVSRSQAAPQDQVTSSSKLEDGRVRDSSSPEIRSPEEALAAFAGHGVEVEARGPVPTDPTDSGHVPVELAGWVGKRRAGSHGLHVWGSRGRQVFICSCQQRRKKLIRCKQRKPPCIHRDLMRKASNPPCPCSQT